MFCDVALPQLFRVLGQAVVIKLCVTFVFSACCGEAWRPYQSQRRREREGCTEKRSSSIPCHVHYSAGNKGVL
jgi:hypothetical protein